MFCVVANKEQKFVFGGYSFTCGKFAIPIHAIWTWKMCSKDNVKVFTNQFCIF